MLWVQVLEVLEVEVWEEVEVWRVQVWVAGLLDQAVLLQQQQQQLTTNMEKGNINISLKEVSENIYITNYVEQRLSEVSNLVG